MEGLMSFQGNRTRERLIPSLERRTWEHVRAQGWGLGSKDMARLAQECASSETSHLTELQVQRPVCAWPAGRIDGCTSVADGTKREGVGPLRYAERDQVELEQQIARGCTVTNAVPAQKLGPRLGGSSGSCQTLCLVSDPLLLLCEESNSPTGSWESSFL